MVLSREQRSNRARRAALIRWSGEDPYPAMARVREGQRRKLEDEVDPDRVLSESERSKRVDRAMRARMLSLSEKSAKARAARVET